jgi:hypothetical protein
MTALIKHCKCSSNVFSCIRKKKINDKLTNESVTHTALYLNGQAHINQLSLSCP